MAEENPQQEGTPAENPPKTYTISGTVYRFADSNPLKFAVLTATPVGPEGNEEDQEKISSFQVTANGDGFYKFENLKPGKWQIQAFHKQYLQPGEETVTLKDANLDKDIFMEPVPSKEEQETGKKFLRYIIAFFTVMALAYILLHNGFPKKTGPLDEDLLGTLDRVSMRVNAIEARNDTVSLAMKDLETAMKAIPKSDSLRKKYLIPAQNQFKKGATSAVIDVLKLLKADTALKKLLQAQELKAFSNQIDSTSQWLAKYHIVSSDSSVIKPLDTIAKGVKIALAENGDLKVSFRDSLAILPARAMKSLKKGDVESLNRVLAQIEVNIQKPRRTRGFHKWNEYPWLILEVLFWALAGILVHIIMSVGGYLRWGKFLSAGIPMHLSHIVAVPIMVVVVMMLLSLVKFEFQLQEGSPVAIDLKNVYVLAAFSFILANRPWGVQRFIKNTGGSITKQKQKAKED